MEVEALEAALAKERRKYKCLQGKYKKEVVSVVSENKRLSHLVESLERQVAEITESNESA